jgi:hypothetical protein
MLRLSAIKRFGKGNLSQDDKVAEVVQTGHFSPTLRFFQGGENLFGFSYGRFLEQQWKSSRCAFAAKPLPGMERIFGLT